MTQFEKEYEQFLQYYIDDPFYWIKIWSNPNIFEYDIKTMIKRRPWREEFYFWVYHPDRISRHVDWGLADELLIHL